jgi:transcriptional regulator with XRE-family HTH domain
MPIVQPHRVPVQLDPRHRSRKKQGERFKDERRTLRWTQAHVAKLIGVHPNTYRRWENGDNNPAARHFSSLANVLGQSEQYLNTRIRVVKEASAGATRHLTGAPAESLHASLGSCSNYLGNICQIVGRCAARLWGRQGDATRRIQAHDLSSR